MVTPTPGAEGGILYNDLKVAIEWPLTVSDISERDKSHLALDENFKGI